MQRAAGAVTTTFEAIGRALAPTTIHAIAAILPAALAEPLRRGSESAGVGDVLVDLAEQEEVSLGVAKEHVQVVLEQLATHIDEPTRAELASLLPAELAGWLVPWRPPRARHEPAVAGRGGSLSTARPGSEHPLASGQPGSEHSVASGRPGSEHPLATARPGSEHPLSEAGSDRDHQR